MAEALSSNLFKGDHILHRILGCIAALSLIPLWASGSLGQALTLAVTLLITGAVIALLLCVPSARLETALKITLVISATSIGITSADYFLRVFSGTTLYHQAHAEYVRKDSSYPLLTKYVPNVDSVRTTFGDLGAISGSPSHRVNRTEIFQTDQFGFRNSPGSSRPPYDMVILGDSFGMGLGSSQEEHWGALLNHERHSVYNLSMPVTCATHGAARLSLEMDRLQLTPGPTIIAPVYTGNDIGDCVDSVESILAHGPQSRAEALISTIQSYRSRSPIRQLSMRLVHQFIITDPVIQVKKWGASENIIFYKPHDRAARMSIELVESNQNFKNLLGGLLKIQEIAKAHQANVVVVSVPTKEEIYGWVLHDETPWSGSAIESGISQAVRAFCAKHNLRYIDLKPMLVAQAKVALTQGELLWWLDDSHWSPRGHQVVAQFMDKALSP